MKSKKAQAAMEFLVTYGWAILGVLVVIGALTYFGFFNTQKYTNDMCSLGDQLTCEEYKADTEGNVYVNVRNNFGVSINITRFEWTSDYGHRVCTNSVIIQPGELGSLGMPCGGLSSSITFPLNEKVKLNIKIMFNRVGSSNSYNQTGEMIVTTEKA